MKNINLKYRFQMNKRDNLIKKLMKFFGDASKSMLKDDTQTWFYTVTSDIAVVCAWISGYDPADEKDNKFQQGEWCIEASIRLNRSSYFVEDWDYVSEGCMISLCEDFQGIAEWLVKVMYECGYIDPFIPLPIPGDIDINLLDFADDVEDIYHIILNERDLLHEWWHYHGWDRDAESAKNLKVWAEYLEEYLLAYEFCDEDNFAELKEYITADKIYQALTKED